MRPEWADYTPVGWPPPAAFDARARRGAAAMTTDRTVDFRTRVRAAPERVYDAITTAEGQWLVHDGGVRRSLTRRRQADESSRVDPATRGAIR